MRAVVFWLLFAIAVAEYAEEPRLLPRLNPRVEEEDVEEPYNDEEHDVHERRKRMAYVEDPFEEHIRVKRRCNGPCRVTNPQNVRVPRQVHQYEVHEFTDESNFPASPPYEEMLAASADHYHRYVVPPPASVSARYLQELPAPVSAAVPAPVNVAPHPEAVPSPVQFIASPLAVGSAANNPLPVDNPVPVPAVPLSQPLKQLSDGDLLGSAAGHHHHKHGGHGHSAGGGHANHGHHYSDHGGKSTKGFNDDHYVDKGGKGYRTDENHRKEYEEAQGKKKKHHDIADHKGGHEEEAYGQRGSHFGEKKGHKKGHKTKGYHNKYHKDEFHKEHKFYDDFHKSGEHHRFGKFNAKHASNESGKKKAHHVNAGHDFVERGKKGYSNKGHVDADHMGYNGKHGHEEHHDHHTEHGKKGGKEGGSHWGYGKKN